MRWSAGTCAENPARGNERALAPETKSAQTTERTGKDRGGRRHEDKCPRFEREVESLLMWLESPVCECHIEAQFRAQADS